MNFNCLILLVFLKSFLSVNNSFQKMQKISDNEGYLVVLDTGLYIYDFEKSNCRIIKNFNNKIINSNNNNIAIPKNINTKIVVLINYHLYVYDMENSNNEAEYKSLEDIFERNVISTFYIQIENSQLILMNIIYESSITPYSVNSYMFEGYLSASNKNKIITKKLDDDYTYEIYCLYDTYNYLIKCIYNQAMSFIRKNLNFVLIQNDSEQYTKIKDIQLEKGNGIQASIISFTYSNNKDFVCDKRGDDTKCFYKNQESDKFFSISYTFEKNCSELNTYYFEEKNQFLMDCKIGNNYNLYIFDGNNINNNIIKKVISILNYNGKH